MKPIASVTMKPVRLTPAHAAVTLTPFEATLPAAFPTKGIDTARLTRTATLAQWLNYWIDDVVTPTREPTTAYCYRSIVRNHLIPALGRVRICDLTPALIQSYYEWTMRSKGLSANTVRKHHILLHTALQLAYRQGILPRNPMDRVSPPKPLPFRQTFYNPEQLALLLSLVEGEPLELPVKLACYLGLRRSEITGLRWCDVDLVRGQLHVCQVRTSCGMEVVCKAPKTAGSLRTLDFARNEDLAALLTAQRAAHKELLAEQGVAWREDLCVVTEADGSPMHPNRLTARFKRFITASGLPPITIHGLRHTFASVANDAHVPMFQISKALGHSDPTITARIYTHLFDQTHGEVLSAVANAIPGCADPVPL